MPDFIIIGCGEIAHVHAKQILQSGNLVAVCDSVQELADSFARQYNCKAYSDVDELLSSSKADIIIVCSPNGYHAEHCIKSLQSGHDVLCEAPLCLTTAAAWQMIETEKFCRKTLNTVNLIACQENWTSLRRTIENKLNKKGLDIDLHVASGGLETEKTWKQELFPGGGTLYSYFGSMMTVLNFIGGDLLNVDGFTIESFEAPPLEKRGEARLVFKNNLKTRLIWNTEEKEKRALLKIDDETESLLLADPEDARTLDQSYEAFYTNYLRSRELGEKSNLYNSMKIVDMMEKIYKELQPNSY